MGTDVRTAVSAEVPVPPVVRRGSRLRRIAWGFAPVLTFVGLIALWAALVSVFQIPDYLVPAPQAVIPRLIQARQALWVNSMTTLREIVFGFAITVVLSIPLGLLLALSLLARRLAYPVLVFIQLVPKIAIAPLFLVWFGFGIQSKVLLTVLLIVLSAAPGQHRGVPGAGHAAPVPDSIHGRLGLADLLARAVSERAPRDLFGAQGSRDNRRHRGHRRGVRRARTPDSATSSWSRPALWTRR